jgi:putative FmdB family regulatory protein
MPIYAYRCAACGHAKDVLQKLSDAPLADCPACGEPRFEKQVTAAGFQLKGSGWYATDFRNGQAEKPAAKADGQTDAKPAAEGAAAATPATATPAPASAPAASTVPASPPASSS